MIETYQSRLVGIAGASGVGKSTVALELQDLCPERIEVVHFDDFQKSNEEIVRCLGSLANWDDPQVTDFVQAYEGLMALKSGRPTTLSVKNEFDNPDFIGKGIFKRFPKTVQPADFVVVEGHYVLYDDAVRGLFDLTIFLRGDVEISTARRTKGTDEAYNADYLLPMFNRYVSPTEMEADCVINVDGFDAKSVVKIVEAVIQDRLGSLRT